MFNCILNIIHVAPKRRTNIQTEKNLFFQIEHQGLLMAVLIAFDKKKPRKSKVKGYC